MDIKNSKNKDIKDELIEKIAQNPADENNYIELGKIYIGEADYENALGVYESLLKVNPLNSQALINAGSLNFYFKNIDKSINYYSRAAEIESKSFLIYMNLGNAYELEPNSAALYNAIGLLFQDKKDFLTAIVYYDKAINCDPNDPETYINKASAKMSMHMYKEAIKALKQAVILEPANLKATICIANCYASLKDFENADKFFERCYQIDNTAYQVYVCHAIAYSDANRIDMAISKYKEAISIAPAMPNAYILLGNIYVDRKMYNDAVECYQKASAICPNDAKIYSFIGNTYFMLEDLPNAIETYRKALKCDEKSIENKLVYIEILQEYIKRKEESKTA